MVMHPSLGEQLGANRRRDLERETTSRRAVAMTAAERAVRRGGGRSALARHVGALLIAAGSRLTDGEGLRAAFDHGPRS